MSLYEVDWLGHILLAHPEMVGKEELVKRAVEDPKHLREGDYADSRAFEIESTTNPEGIRVFVRYVREMFVNGGVDGNVTTAYPINSKQYQSRVGPIIYTRPEAGKKK